MQKIPSLGTRGEKPPFFIFHDHMVKNEKMKWGIINTGHGGVI